MSQRTLLLGLDVGTSGCKAALYALDGEVVALASAPLRTERPHPGYVEQDPDGIWSAAADAIRAAIRQTDVQPAEVLGVGVCGHSPTLILLDAAGRPARPAILWQDTRAGAEARELAAALGPRWAELLGAHFPVTPSFAPARLLWIRRHEPEALSRARRAIETKDYVNYRLTGVVASDHWSSKGLAHLVTGRLVPAWPDLLGIHADLVPELAEPHRAIGEVTPKAAAELGLRVGTPVAAGWTDGLASMVGTGTFVGGGLGYFVSGTSDTIGTVVSGAPTGDRRLFEVPAPAGRRVVMGPNQCGGASLAWFADRFLGGDVGRALELAATAPPGAGGLVFLPYLEGERTPIWDERARGVFFGLTTAHGPAELARAILEGVAASDRHIVETIEEVAGVAIERLRTAGGASGGFWGQVKADMLGRPLEATSEQPGTLGSAILAGVAAAVWPDIDAATRAVVAVSSRIEPNPGLRSTCDDVYQTYRALYPRLKDLWGS